jgi:predicted CXXCH cytochrome family protein
MTAKRDKQGRLSWTAAVAAALVVGALGPACASPEQKYQVLSFFFDGVPPLEGAAKPGTAEAPTVAEELMTAEIAPKWPRPRSLKLIQHDPYAGDECEECHDSAFSNALVMPQEKLCWTCHDREDFEGQVVHGPMAAGECSGCHDPHESPNPDLLVRAPSALCERCHDESTFPIAQEHRAEQGDDCLECHDPHAADREFMLRESVGRS